MAGAGKTGVEDTAWIDVANVTAKMGKTTAVIGRQKLDTPLAFTETWNIVENTFDAFTFVNGDIPKTKLICFGSNPCQWNEQLYKCAGWNGRFG